MHFYAKEFRAELLYLFFPEKEAGQPASFLGDVIRIFTDAASDV